MMCCWMTGWPLPCLCHIEEGVVKKAVKGKTHTKAGKEKAGKKEISKGKDKTREDLSKSHSSSKVDINPP